jgi:hypothetical protein
MIQWFIELKGITQAVLVFFFFLIILIVIRDEHKKWKNK